MPAPDSLLELLPGYPPDVLKAAWDQLDPKHQAALAWRATWLSQRKPHQVDPDGDWWHIWLMLAGRGSGKSRTGAEWIGWEASTDPNSRSLVAAPTSGDLRDVCFEGESGLLNVIPKPLIRSYSRSLHELILHNGALIKGIPASEPERFRGPQWHRAWCDELCSWDQGGGQDEDSWDMIAFSLRLGQNPRLFISTTPKPKRLLKNILSRTGKDVFVTRASTYDNLENLAPTFREQVLQYDGTKIGRQEIYAEVLDPEDEGIVKRSSIRLWPSASPLPEFDVVLMSLDTAFSERHVDDRGRRDPTACSVWGGFWHEKRPGIMLLDAWEDHLTYPDLVERVKRESAYRYGGDADRPLIEPAFGPIKPLHSGKAIDFLVIEDKGSGISLRQSLARDGILTHPYNPGRADKLTRLHIVSPLFAQGYVWAVESDKKAGSPKSWAEPLISQVCSYSGEDTIPNDDLLDTATQALRVLNDRWLRSASQRPKLGSQHRSADVVQFRPRNNPYAA